MSNLSAPVLGQLLLMQSVLEGLPDELAIRSFVCRGLSDLPGVRAVEWRAESGPTVEDPAVCFPLLVGDAHKGELILRLADRAAFMPYEPYLKNFCFMVAVILKERLQRSLDLDRQAALEERVKERTAELVQQVDVAVQARRALQDILEGRTRAEAALRTSENKFRALTHQMPDLVWEKDANSVYVSCNKRYADTLGLTPETIAGHRDEDFYPADLAAKYRADDQQVIASGQALETEERWLQGKEVRWLLTHKGPLLDPQGRCVGTIGIGRDVTARKRAEMIKETLFSLATKLSAAGTSAEVARSVFAAADRLWKWDAGTLDLVWPGEALVETVLCIDTLAGERREVSPNERWGEPTPRHRRVSAHGAELILRSVDELKVSDSVVFGDTSRLSASIMCVPIRRRGQSVGVLSIQSYTPDAYTPEDLETLQGLSDYCGGALERIQAEARLRQQAALLDAANDAIYVCALDHTVTYWNEGAERLYGWSRAEALGRKITEFGEVDPAAFEAAHGILLAEDSWSGELKKTTKTGKPFDVFCRWTLLRDERGRPAEVLAINTDITEKKQLEANYLRAQRLEGIGALAGGIAHDLNNILSPILMTAPLLREAVTAPDDREMLNTMETCAQRGADIIRQLLTFARGKPGDRAPLPARHLLREMDKIIRETFPRNIQSRLNAPNDLWPILGDATQIHQALMNLCLNARDAMPGGGLLTLAAENFTVDEAFATMTPGAKPGEHVRLTVSDTGAGIAPENVDRIFDPFFTTKEIGKGTGLGLSTVLGIMRGHGGFVRVQSCEGTGTTFELFFPASREKRAAAAVDPEPLPPQGHGELILVVDDETSVRSVVQRALEKHGYRVLVAAEGIEALALFSQHRAEIRAVLTDMMMPVMDGPKLVRALRKQDASLPILGMTGLAERSVVEDLESLDLPMVLTKPFEGVKLLVALREVMAQANAHLSK